MTDYPEINLARTLIKKYDLRPPVDIERLAKHYASVEVIPLPIGLDVDGATFDLKVSGKRPKIIVNDNRPPTRRRFTIAHELGHVLVPWHIGSILDEVVLADPKSQTPYWQLEGEANRFASEILLPSDWIVAAIEKFKNPPTCLEHIVSTADVSRLAAVITLTNYMPSGYIFAIVNETGAVTSSGRSPGTLANAPTLGSVINRKAIYPVKDKTWESHQNDGVYLWWHLPREDKLPEAADIRGWREILDEMIEGLGLPADKIEKFKQSIN